MITTKKMYEKTYDEMLDEALKQIPLYTEEWTNFNPSDPGITILENLSSFQELQQMYIGSITDEVRENLLKLAGFHRKSGRIARVLLECPSLGTPRLMSANQRFLLGNVSFETTHAMELYGYAITGIFAEHDKQLHDYTYLTDTELPMSVEIFGSHPKAGDCIYFVCNGMARPNEETIFYCQVSNNCKRNPFSEYTQIVSLFAQMKWECFTKQGYEEIHVKDNTACFLVSGEMKFRMPTAEAEESAQLPVKGYILKGTLTSSRYDIPPQILSIKGFLFEVWQKETLSICHTYNKYSTFDVICNLLEEGYFRVFCKEDKESSYRLYQELPDEGAKGRYYTCNRNAFGSYTFQFDKKKYKFGPARVKNAVKIVAYNEFIMRRYYLGIVMGYDDQTIELPVKHLVPETFSIIAERIDKNGEAIYDFVKPNRLEEGSLSFMIEEDTGIVTIADAGDFIEAKLYLCACAVTKGTDGNICEKNTFLATGLLQGMHFTNPGVGTGGTFRESVEELRTRFVTDLNRPATAVTAQDYNLLVQSTPGLCIDKVHTYMEEEKHVVNIVVKPRSKKNLSQLSREYQHAIYKQLEKSRLITTRVKLVQPKYVAVDVIGTVYMKQHMRMSKELIEETINKFLDFNYSNRNFGETLKFDELFFLLEQLDCVAYVADLALHPQNKSFALMQGLDIKPLDNCLCYPGKLDIGLMNYRE